MTKLSLTTLALTALLIGCTSKPPIDQYTLTLPSAMNIDKSPQGQAKKPNLIIAQISVDSVFDDKSIYYQRTKGEIESFTKSQWITNPSKMLQPLFVDALEKTNHFNAIIALPAEISGQSRVDITLTHFNLNYLKEDHSAQVGFRVRLIDVNSGALRYSRTYEKHAAVTSDSAKAGVNAMNTALADVIPRIINDLVKAHAPKLR